MSLCIQYDQIETIATNIDCFGLMTEWEIDSKGCKLKRQLSQCLEGNKQ